MTTNSGKCNEGKQQVTKRKRGENYFKLKCHIIFEKEISNWHLMSRSCCREKDFGRRNSIYKAFERERSMEY